MFSKWRRSRSWRLLK